VALFLLRQIFAALPAASIHTLLSLFRLFRKKKKKFYDHDFIFWGALQAAHFHQIEPIFEESGNLHVGTWKHIWFGK
jgi:hypothetical protein